VPGSNNPNEIVVGGNGRILVAEVGTAAPADITEAASASWTELGYVSDEGVTFTVGKEIEDVNVWQSFYAVRRLMTAQSGQLGFELAQWNRDTVPLAFGGGTISEPAAGAYRYTPPEPGPIDERALILEFEDGDYSFRIVVPVGMVTEDVETTLNKAPNGVLPITFGVNGQEGVAPWYLDTDHPAFAPLGSS
jgi:hypothetical protein